MNPASGPVSANLTGKDAEAAHRTGAAGPPRVGVETRRRVALATCFARTKTSTVLLPCGGQ